MIINAEEQAMKEVIALAENLMAEWSSGRNKQKQFVIEYVKENFSNAAEATRNAGYSEKTARQQANTLLNTEHIKDVIIELQKAFDERATELSIMSSVEIKQFLTRVARGQEQEQTLRGMGEGYQQITDIDVSAKDRIRAAELLGKSMKMWTDRTEHSVEVPIFIDDLVDDDE